MAKVTFSETSALPAGTVVAGQFRVERLLGEGGMGTVYLAEQLGVGRPVVVKLMKAVVVEGQRGQLEERFQREARLVAQLNHPNLVQLYTFGRSETGELYLAMEYVAGQTLRQLLQAQGPLPEARALGIVEQICGALHEAHILGIVHRDLKPDNVMVVQRHGNPDFVKVLDFGIAKLLGPARTLPEKALTAEGAIFGTPQYMAPEQVYARQVDPRTDVYALGLITYELLVGAAVFEADSAIEVMMKHTSAPVELPSTRRQGLHLRPSTARLIECSLEKEPERRFADMLEMQAVVRAALREEDALTSGASADGHTPQPRPDADPPVGGTIPPLSERGGWLKKRVRVVSLVAAFVLVSAALPLIYDAWFGSHTTREPSSEPTAPPEPGPDPTAPPEPVPPTPEPPPGPEGSLPEGAPPQVHPVPPADERMEALQQKYQGYVLHCFNGKTPDFVARQAYLSSVSSARGPEPGATADVRETSDPRDCDEQLARLTADGAELQLDRSARRFAAALRALHELTQSAARYYQEEYGRDSSARGRELHPRIVAAFADFVKTHAELRRDLSDAERLLRFYFAGRATEEESAQIAGDVSASMIARLCNVHWREIRRVDRNALEQALGTYDRVLARQREPDPHNAQLAADGEQCARRAEDGAWNDNERSLLQAGQGATVDGAPQKLVTDYLEVEALFERLPLQEEVFVELLPAKKKR